jgi:outer membrane protein OmpA-like peptidoglycan-associated protein
MASIIEMIRGAITPDVLKASSTIVGEDGAAVQKTMSAAAPSILGGVLGMGSTLSGADRLRSMITDGRFGADTLSGFANMLQGGSTTDSLLSSGERVLSGLFGGKGDQVADAVAGAGGVKRGSAATILRLAAPLVMSVIGKVMATRNLDGRGLMNLLGSERSSILSALPAGMSGILGLDEQAPAAAHGRTQERERVHEPVREPTFREPVRHERDVVHVQERHHRKRWGPGLLAALAGLGLLYFLTRGRDRDVRVNVPPAAERITEPMQPVQPVRPPEVPELTRPGRVTEIDAYMSDPSATGPRTFVLDEITFESGSSRLTTDARKALRDLAILFKKHPNARIRIEGHTDNKGNAAANRRLSKERADAVKKVLVDGGVISTVVETTGVGPDQPVASNDNEAGRAQNRRTQIVITKR